MLPLVEGPDLSQGVLFLVQKTASPLHCQPTRLVELDSVLAPGEQGHAEGLLDVAHGAGERRRGDVELLGRTAQRAQLGKGDKLFEFGQVKHGGTPHVSQNEKQIATSIVYIAGNTEHITQCVPLAFHNLEVVTWSM